MFILHGIYFMCYFVLTHSSNPGLTAQVNSLGFDYLGTETKQFLERHIPGIRLDDISGDADSPVGKIKFKASDVTLVSFISNAPIFNVNHGQMTTAFENMYVFLKGKFEYKSWFARDHVHFDIYAKKGAVDLTMIFGLTPNGHPQVKSRSCIGALGELDIQFHGGASWLYNFLIKNVIGDIESHMEKLVCEQITQFVNKNLNNQLMDIPTLVKIELPDYPNQIFWWNLSLIESPVLSNQKVLLKCDGHVFTNTTHISSYGSKSNKRIFIPTNKMLDFSLSSFTINSLLNLFFRLDIYRYYKMSKSDLPSNQSDLFNTSCENTVCIGSFIPHLAKYYPNRSIKTNLSLVEAPKVELKEDQAHINYVANLDVYVTDGNSSAHASSAEDQFVFSFYSSTNYSLHFAVINDVLKAKIFNVTSSNHVYNSKIGHLSDRQMDYFFDVLNQNVIIKLLNKVLYKTGLHIPDSRHTKLVNPIIYLFENVLQMSMDLQYIP